MATATVSNRTTIYVALLDEGTPVWRPVAADRIADDRYLIVGVCDTDDETWQFSPGSVVRCEMHEFADGRRCLTAMELIVPAG